jgi:hypothetical protein
MTAPIKNPTAWRPPSGQGSVVEIGNLPLVANTLLPLVDNTASHLPIDTTPSYTLPKNPTSWINEDVKNPTAWRPPSGQGSVITVGLQSFIDNLGNFLTDNLGNFIVTTPTYDAPKNPTAWTQVG